MKLSSTRTKLKCLSSKSKDKPKKPEHLSDRDLAELMGVHRDRYGRKDGAMRRK